jgi:serine O-acetyltransferase
MVAMVLSEWSCGMERERRVAGFRELLALVREDLRHNGGIMWPGFQALAVHRFGVWKDGIAAKPLRIPFTILHRLAYGFVRNVYGIELPHTARIGRRLVVAHQHGIIVHTNAVIGDDCVLRQGVAIGQSMSTPGVAAWDVPAPRLGDRVELGAGSVVMGKVVIGDGARIGPNAVVMTSVPAGAIVTAPPARIMAPPPKRRPAPEPPAAAAGEPAPAPATRRTGT